MFLSLNKKFFFTIFAFFLLCCGIFIIIFDTSVGKKLRSEHSNLITRNQYVIELLNENILLRQKINQLEQENSKKFPDSLNQKQNELAREKKLNEELNQNYNENYATLVESLKIISFSASLTFISIIILWFLLRRWVITPIEKLTDLSIAVANGDFTKRLPQKNTKFTDEFSILMHTINFMLDNINNNINQIKEKEVFLQNLIDSLPDAVRVIDENYNIVLSNKTYAEHIEQKYFNHSEKCYKSYHDQATCPCNQSQYICPLKELKKYHQSNIKLIHSVNNKPLSINAQKISLNGNFCIVESIRDLSDNISYSHQQKISSLGFLATSLAHEMKNNLGAINMILTGILQKYYKDDTQAPEEKQYLEMIAGQIKECIKVPERLLKLSRNTNQKDTSFNAIPAIVDILSLLDYEIKRKGIALIKNLSNTKEKIYGNETDFKMIILNLVQNAINAMPNGGKLEVKTNTNKEYFNISIKDNGCGIKKAALKHIFEPFYSTSAPDEKKGTGLGLAIVKDLLLKLNGKITVNSTENIGSCFEISIPRNKMPQ